MSNLSYTEAFKVLQRRLDVCVGDGGNHLVLAPGECTGAGRMGLRTGGYGALGRDGAARRVRQAQTEAECQRAGDAHWQALIRHHTDAYPKSRPTPGDVARAEAGRLNALGVGDNPNPKLVESLVEQVPPAVRITHVFEDRAEGARFETEPFTGYE